MATTKASFMGARPGLLLPAPFEVPAFLKHNAQVPQSTRGAMPIQLPITPCSSYQNQGAYAQPYTSYPVLSFKAEPQFPDQVRGGERYGLSIK